MTHHYGRVTTLSATTLRNNRCQSLNVSVIVIHTVTTLSSNVPEICGSNQSMFQPGESLVYDDALLGELEESVNKADG